jgi:hypothetical protein
MWTQLDQTRYSLENLHSVPAIVALIPVAVGRQRQEYQVSKLIAPKGYCKNPPNMLELLRPGA